MKRLLWFHLCVLAFLQVRGETDRFTEELLLKPLYTNKLYAHFQFTTRWDVDRTDDLLQTHLFPRALAELILAYDVRELHIGLTAGLWRYESWGYPMIDAAPGAEAWAWFEPHTVDVDANWRGLTNALSGLVCASLNFLDATNSISPEMSLRPRGVVQGTTNSSFLRYGSLPREIVCTENLTPWKKLLPCDSRAGLATLLNAGHIHGTHYHSVGLHLRPVCRDPDCTQTSLELQQTVSLVYDYTILGTRNWSLRKLFGQGIINSCPLADTSAIYVDVTSNSSTPFVLSPEADEYLDSSRGGYISRFAKYDLKKARPMSVAATHSGPEVFHVTIPPPLHGGQYRTGYGQQNGGIVTKLYNNHWTSLDVVLLQNLPWYVPVYLHTLKIVRDNVELRPLTLKYAPGKLRERYHRLELGLRLPPKSTTTISVDFDYVFLKWQEYPPDANHGFYVGSAIVSAMLPLAKNYTGLPQDGALISDAFNASRSGYLVQVRLEPMIITLPTPDFSMPYNVICLACTVVALAFGPLHNITTKRLILKVNDKKGLLGKLKAKLKGLFSK